MVIGFFVTSRPSPMEWSLISFFTSRPSTRQWSLISLSHQDPLQWNGHWFLSLHQCLLQDNDHWFLCHMKTFSFRMAIDFLMQIHLVTYKPFPWDWPNLFFLWTGTLSLGMVESIFFFGSRPSSLNWSLYMLDLFFFLFFFESQTKLVFLSLLIFYFDNLWKLKFHTIK